MDSKTAKMVIDACHAAGQAVAMMPSLPDGVTPLYVRIIDAIEQLDRTAGHVYVSDVSRTAGVSMPGVTRALNALEKLGAVKKTADPADRRFVSIELTELGQSWYQTFVGDFYEELSDEMGDISSEDAAAMGRVVNRVKEALNRMSGKTGSADLAENGADET
jgi:DNA-binding MarR family transcriptional regulator